MGVFMFHMNMIAMMIGELSGDSSGSGANLVVYTSLSYLSLRSRSAFEGLATFWSFDHSD
jgi:hypothetical protein